MDDPDINAEEDENITHMAVVTQEPPPGVARVKIPAQSMNQRIFTILLSTLEHRRRRRRPTRRGGW
eukprot:scaffold1896_cov121-Isochrysis_galbana.AAC.21